MRTTQPSTPSPPPSAAAAAPASDEGGVDGGEVVDDARRGHGRAGQRQVGVVGDEQPAGDVRLDGGGAVDDGRGAARHAQTKAAFRSGGAGSVGGPV